MGSNEYIYTPRVISSNHNRVISQISTEKWSPQRHKQLLKSAFAKLMGSDEYNTPDDNNRDAWLPVGVNGNREPSRPTRPR